MISWSEVSTNSNGFYTITNYLNDHWCEENILFWFNNSVWSVLVCKEGLPGKEMYMRMWCIWATTKKHPHVSPATVTVSYACTHFLIQGIAFKWSLFICLKYICTLPLNVHSHNWLFLLNLSWICTSCALGTYVY